MTFWSVVGCGGQQSISRRGGAVLAGNEDSGVRMALRANLATCDV